jgi:hypothetical protein
MDWKLKVTLIAIVSFIAGFAVYDIFFVDLYLATKTSSADEASVVAPECPGEKYLYDTGFTWTEQFWQQNPNATDADWTDAWNSMLREIGCYEYQVTVADIHYSGILADLIYASSTDEVTCPTEDEVSGVFEHWYNYYMRGSATSTDEAAIEGWNDIMVQNGCKSL